MKLQGKTAIITGAAKGIGAAVSPPKALGSSWPTRMKPMGMR